MSARLALAAGAAIIVAAVYKFSHGALRSHRPHAIDAAPTTDPRAVAKFNLHTKVAAAAATGASIKYKSGTQQGKATPEEEQLLLIDRAAIAQIGKSKLVYYLILAGSGAPGPHC